jgi:hypothetical protein
LGGGEDCGGFFGDAGAFEEMRVLRAPQLDRVREGEGAEIVRRDVAAIFENGPTGSIAATCPTAWTAT